MAWAGAIGEGIGFYGGFIAVQLQRRRHLLTDRTSWWRHSWLVCSGLVVEFGPSELLDTLFIRPAAMYGATVLAGSVALGVTIGKIVADVVFYLVAVAVYELFLRKRDRWHLAAAPVSPAANGFPLNAARILVGPAAVEQAASWVATRAPCRPADQRPATARTDHRPATTPIDATGPGWRPGVRARYGRSHRRRGGPTPRPDPPLTSFSTRFSTSFRGFDVENRPQNLIMQSPPGGRNTAFAGYTGGHERR